MRNTALVTGIHALVLIILGLLGYMLYPGRPSYLLLVPGTGILLLIFTPAIKKKSKPAHYVVATLTFLIMILTASICWNFAEPTAELLELLDREKINNLALVYGLLSINALFLLAAFSLASLKSREMYRHKELRYREGKSLPNEEI